MVFDLELCKSSAADVGMKPPICLYKYNLRCQGLNSQEQTQHGSSEIAKSGAPWGRVASRRVTGVAKRQLG